MTLDQYMDEPDRRAPLPDDGGGNGLLNAPLPPAVAAPLRAAFAALDAAGVRWALLRGIDNLAHPERDVDLLLAEHAWRSLDDLLSKAGFNRVRFNGHGPHRLYLGLLTDDGLDLEWITLHCHASITFGPMQEVRTDLAPGLLDRAQRVGGISVLEPADMFWHSLLHYFVDRGEVPVRKRGALQRLVPGGPGEGPMRDFLEQLAPGLPERVRQAVREGRWDFVYQAGRTFRRRLRRQAGWPRVQRRALLQCVARRVGTGGGVSVALLGPDGAGKTTLARGLEQSLPVPVRYFYMAVWKEARGDRLLRYLPGARLGARLLRFLFTALRIAYHRRLGRVVVLDRFTVDADLPKELDWRGRLSARLVRRTNVDPDLLVLLDAPVQVMFARKGELGLRELQIRRDAYLAMASRYPRLVVIDATQSRDDVRHQVRDLIWSRLTEASTRKSAHRPS